ncbi:peptidase domain-containing ABC transporter [Nostoc sp. FACHB-973]|nr:peptidase domain-containing ABC transporter [Nostoc sp. FACHB-973]
MKYSCVLQQNEEDCGAACLASIAKHYGRDFTISRIREAIGTNRRGSTLLGIRRGAESLGFNARAIKASADLLDQLDNVPLPAILHWKGVHFTVLYGKKGNKYVLANPAVGVYFLPKSELLKGWTNWIMLLLEPDLDRFFSQADDREKMGGLGRIFNRVWFYRSILVQVLIINLVLGLLGIIMPFLLQILTDDVLVRGDFTLLTRLAIATGLFIGMSSGLSLVQSSLVAYFAQRLELGIVLDFVRHLLHLPLSYYESRRSGEVISRLRDIQDINWLVAQVVVDLPSKFFVALIALVLIFFYSWQLAIATLIIGVCMTLSAIVFQPQLHQLTRQTLVLSAENQAGLVETFKGAQTIKTIAATPQVWEEFQNRFGRLAKLTLRTLQIGIINDVFANFVGGLGGIILLWFGSSLVIQQKLTVGQLIAFNAMSSNLLMFIDTYIRLINEFIRVKAATQRINEVLDLTPENISTPQKPIVTIPDNADIVCTDVNFQYAGRVKLLDNFSVTIPGKQVIALIGKSGCGKSTLTKLLAGLYSLQSGNIRIGGYNLQDLPLDTLRQQVVLVPQAPHFWSLSIIENFRLAHPHAAFEEIVHACSLTGADNFISQLPDKYQTILGEFGANLSGGQLQRLAIARAIVTDPPVLILDESTGALDPLSEKQVLEQLLIKRQGKTTLLISHRPSVISQANWIVLIEDGQLKHHGSLEQLQALPGDHWYFISP